MKTISKKQNIFDHKKIMTKALDAFNESIDILDRRIKRNLDQLKFLKKTSHVVSLNEYKKIQREIKADYLQLEQDAPHQDFIIQELKRISDVIKRPNAKIIPIKKKVI